MNKELPPINEGATELPDAQIIHPSEGFDGVFATTEQSIDELEGATLAPVTDLAAWRETRTRPTLLPLPRRRPRPS